MFAQAFWGSEAGPSVRGISHRGVTGKGIRGLDPILDLVVEQPRAGVRVEGAQIMNFSDPQFSPVKTAGRMGWAQKLSLMLRTY